MTSPFPVAPDPFAQQHVILIKERGVHVPTWYVPHERPHEITVTVDHVAMLPTIKVDMIAPERRWAVKLDGELLDQRTFKDFYKKKYIEWFAVCQPTPQKVRGKPDNIWIPHVTEYVQWKVDVRNPKSSRLLPIHEAPDTTGAKPAQLVDGEGEIVEGARMDHLVAAYHDPNLRAKLTPREIEEVEAHLQGMGLRPSLPSDLATKLETLNEMLAEGDITSEVHSRRVAMLTGVTLGPDRRFAPVPPAPALKAETLEIQMEKPNLRGKSIMACGELVTNFHKKHHIAKCGECLSVQEAVA